MTETETGILLLRSEVECWKKAYKDLLLSWREQYLKNRKNQ